MWEAESSVLHSPAACHELPLQYQDLHDGTHKHIRDAHTTGQNISAEGVDPATECLKSFHLSTVDKIARSLPGSHSNRGNETRVSRCWQSCLRYAKSNCADAKGSLEVTSNRDCIKWLLADGYASTRWNEAGFCMRYAQNQALLALITTQQVASGKLIVPLDWTVVEASARSLTCCIWLSRQELLRFAPAQEHTPVLDDAACKRSWLCCTAGTGCRRLVATSSRTGSREGTCTVCDESWQYPNGDLGASADHKQRYTRCPPQTIHTPLSARDSRYLTLDGQHAQPHA